MRAHVGLTAARARPGVRSFDNRFLREYRYRSDHNGMKGYIAAYVLKAATEKVGKFDPKALAEAMKNVALTAQQYPGILLDVKYDDKGDISRHELHRAGGRRAARVHRHAPGEGLAQAAAAPKK